jgi:hypothetical protein
MCDNMVVVYPKFGVSFPIKCGYVYSQSGWTRQAICDKCLVQKKVQKMENPIEFHVWTDAEEVLCLLPSTILVKKKFPGPFGKAIVMVGPKEDVKRGCLKVVEAGLGNYLSVFKEVPGDQPAV